MEAGVFHTSKRVIRHDKMPRQFVVELLLLHRGELRRRLGEEVRHCRRLSTVCGETSIGASAFWGPVPLGSFSRLDLAHDASEWSTPPKMVLHRCTFLVVLDHVLAVSALSVVFSERGLFLREKGPKGRQ